MTGMKEERERERIVPRVLDERVRARFIRCDTNFIYVKLGFSILLESSLAVLNMNIDYGDRYRIFVRRD